MGHVPPGLASHPDRLRWNARYEAGSGARFTPHPLALRALSMRLPAGPVLDLACGPSGSCVAAASAGRRACAVDISEVALGLLDAEARRRGLGELITTVHADLRRWRPRPGGYALVLCTGYWDRSVFAAAAEAVAAGGLLGWEAFTAGARRSRPSLPAQWCLQPGEPGCLLPAGYAVVELRDLENNGRGTTRRMLARRR
jgi:SAM-dependent methyltransferase